MAEAKGKEGSPSRAGSAEGTLHGRPPGILHPGHPSCLSLVPTLPCAPSWQGSVALILSPALGTQSVLSQLHGGNGRACL